MSRKRLFITLLSLPLAAPAAGSGDTWQVCHLQVQIIRHVKEPYWRALQARVLDVQAASAVNGCPSIGAIITFQPETPDYQSLLVYKRWPKTGQTIRMRYQYLDGYCKREGGDRPCRIEHYPVP